MLSKDPVKAEEQRKRISLAAQKSHSDPAWKERQRQARLKLWGDPKYAEKSVSNMLVAIADPSIKIKHREACLYAHTLPSVKENSKIGYRKRSNSPSWIANHAAANPIRSAALSGDKCHLWKGGISFFPYCIKFNNRRRRAVRLFFNNTCICCGEDMDSNIYRAKGGTVKPHELCVHHVDHDREQGCNGKLFNLVPFCKSCHGLEQADPEGYAAYINKTLEEGFKWGIWSEKEYIKDVMYPE